MLPIFLQRGNWRVKSSVMQMFNDILTRLAAIHGVPPERLSHFSARIRNLRRVGWPEGMDGLVGRRANWTSRQFLEVAVAMELTALGFTRERAIQIIKANYTTLLSAACLCGSCEIRVPPLIGDTMPKSTIRVDFGALAGEQEKAA
jgi:hypothetical protein